MSSRKKNKYPIVDDLYYNNRIDNTTINIDKTVSRLLHEMCKQYTISMYKALNIMVHDFIMSDGHEARIKKFFKQISIKEDILIGTINEVKTGRRIPKNENKIPKRTTRIPALQYSEMAAISRNKNITVQEAMIRAIDDYTAKHG